MLYNLNFKSNVGAPQHFEFVSDYDNEARATTNAILMDWPDYTELTLTAAGDHTTPGYPVSYPS